MNLEKFKIIKKTLTNLFIFLLIINSNHALNNQKYKPTYNKFKNVLLIVADDLGWSDLGYASGEAITPTIDRLARGGIILNQSYTYSMCTPSRNSILTGVFAERTGLQHYVIPNGNPVGAGIPLSFTLMPQYLQKYGYKTHIVGKWHVGSCKMAFTPAHRGFDSFYGFFYGAQNYYTHRMPYSNTITGLDFWNQTKNYLEPILDKNQTYSTFAFNERAVNIIESHDKSKPLFLYYAAQNPHIDGNFNVPKKYENMYKNIKNTFRRKILGMVSLLDESVKMLINSLKKRNMLDNTLIVFTSDNGGEILDYQRNFPLRGGKSGVFEGGHRVRAFINMKGLKPFVYNGMFHSVDWIPTILSGALNRPINIQGIDGVNQWTSITKNYKSKRDSFIYKIDPYGERQGAKRCYTSTESVRLNDWKLIKGCPGLITGWYNLTDYDPDFSQYDFGQTLNSQKQKYCYDRIEDKNSRYYLFNLKNDPLERINLAKLNPCKVLELSKKLNEYKKITVEPQIKEPRIGNPKANPALWGDKWSPGWC